MLKKIKTIIALGYFDSVHIGHKDVIDKCVLESKKQNIVPSLFTFSGNLKSIILGEDDKPVYSFDDRKNQINSLGINEIFSLPVNDEVLSMDKLTFLNLLNDKYDIYGYVFGEDFSFGHFGEGKPCDIIAYAEEHNQHTFIVPLRQKMGKKISTSNIKYLLKNGEIESANSLLTYPYHVSGEVIHDRGIGKSLGFPTANICVPKNLLEIFEGVYAGRGYVNDKMYPAIINYGNRPTFNLTEKVMEVYFDGLNEDIYGKTIKVEFLSFIRGIKKFDSKDELKEQLLCDVDFLRKNLGENYD